MALTFARPRLITFAGNNITDHNRTPLGTSVERIETKNRMANGIARKYWVADKRTFTTSWDMLPTVDTQTVDGFHGAQWIRDFYLANQGAFTLGVTNQDLSVASYSVMFTAFDYNVQKRWKTLELWSVNLTMEEV